LFSPFTKLTAAFRQTGKSRPTAEIVDLKNAAQLPDLLLEQSLERRRHTASDATLTHTLLLYCFFSSGFLRSCKKILVVLWLLLHKFGLAAEFGGLRVYSGGCLVSWRNSGGSTGLQEAQRDLMLLISTVQFHTSNT